MTSLKETLARFIELYQKWQVINADLASLQTKQEELLREDEAEAEAEISERIEELEDECATAELELEQHYDSLIAHDPNFGVVLMEPVVILHGGRYYALFLPVRARFPVVWVCRFFNADTD